MLFAAITFGVSKFQRVEISMLAFRRKIIDFGVLFAAITFGVSIFRGGILATVSS